MNEQANEVRKCLPPLPPRKGDRALAQPDSANAPQAVAFFA